MSFVMVAAITALIVVVSMVLTCVLCIDRQQLTLDASVYRSRFVAIVPFLAAAALFFGVKRVTHEPSKALSEEIAFRITDEIYAVEGALVADMQAVFPEIAYPVLSAFYMFGFPFLLVAAPILYFLAPALGELKRLLVAYLLNYAVGAVAYTLFIAYGPRRHLDSVDGMMYDMYPETQEMTAAISDATDVFPSLHTSLAVVVFIFAWRTRHVLPRWFTIAGITSSAVVLSTMALGIHWAIDVLFGILLAVWSVYAADRLVGLVEGSAGGPSPEEPIGTAADGSGSPRSDD